MNGSKYIIVIVLSLILLLESHSAEISENIEDVNSKLHDKSSQKKLSEDIQNNIKAKSIDPSQIDVLKEKSIYDDEVPTFTEYQKIVAEENIQKRKGVVSASVTPEPSIIPITNSKSDITVNLSIISSTRVNLSNVTNSASSEDLMQPGTLASKISEALDDPSLSGAIDNASAAQVRSITDNELEPTLRQAAADGKDELKSGTIQSVVENEKIAKTTEDFYAASSSLEEASQISSLPSDMLMKNVAAAECSAKVLAHNPEAKNAAAVLIEDRDVYMNHPCSATKWLVIELCEPVQVRRLEIANYELFSSSPKTFNVSLAEKYPTKEWSFLGSFQARDERQLQSFSTEGEDKFFRYMTFHFVDHYGREHFCPLSTIRVFGILTEDIDDEQPNIPNLPPVKQLIKQFPTAEPEQRQTQIPPPKTLENVVVLEEKMGSMLLPISLTASEEAASSGPKQSDFEKMALKELEMKSEAVLVNNETCNALSSTNRHSYDILDARLSTSNASLYQVFLSRCFLRLYMSGVSLRPSQAAALCTAIQIFPECRFYSCMSNVTTHEISRLFVHWVAFEFGRRMSLFELLKFVSTDVQETAQPSINTTAAKIMIPTIIDDSILARRSENENKSLDVDDKAAPTLISRHVVTTPSPAVIDGTDNRLAGAAKVVPASNRKESSAAIMRLTNRVKALELNISVSMHYLEELSCSYKKQTERVKTDEEHRQRHLQALMAHWERRARTAEKREMQIRSRLLRLESRLDTMSSAAFLRQEQFYVKRIFSEVAVDSVREELARLIGRFDQMEASLASQRGLVNNRALRRIYQSRRNVILDRSFGGFYLWMAGFLTQFIIVFFFLWITGWRRCTSCKCSNKCSNTATHAPAAALGNDGDIVLQPSISSVNAFKNRKEEKRRRARHEYLQKSNYTNGHGHSNINCTALTQRWSPSIQDLLKNSSTG